MGGPRTNHKARLAGLPDTVAGAVRERKASAQVHAPSAPTQLVVPGFAEKASDKEAACETLTWSSEWKAFRESVESTLEIQFRKQESFIQRCLQRMIESPASSGTRSPEESDEAWQQSLESQFRKQEGFIQRCFEQLAEAPAISGARSPAEDSDEARTQSLEASVRRIESLLEGQALQASASQAQPSGTWMQESRMCGEATGESRMPAESMGSHKDWTIMEEPRPPEMDVPYGGSEGGCLGGSEGTASFSSDPENSRMRRQGSANSFRDHSNLRMGRRPSLKKKNKLNWQIVVQDRESAELTSQRSSGTLSMKEQYDARFNKWLDWWMSLEEPERTGCLARFIFTKKFETACAIVIIGNAFFAAYTTNWEVTNLSEEPNSITEAVETSFLSFYLFELILKFLVHQVYFFCNDDMRWNIFDLFLVVTSVYYQVSLWATSAGGMDLTYMRTLRVLKLARILRVIRVAKIFTELRLMLNSILGSFISLFWAFVMLGIVFYTFGLVFVQGTTTYLIAHGPELDRALWHGYDAWWRGSAEALKLAQPDRDVLALEHRKRELVEAEELREICEKLDMNGSGTIDIDEFRGNFQHGKLMAHLQVLGLQIKDADMFFHMLMDSSDPPPSEQVLDISDFVAGCMRLRGSATNLDLQTILYCLNLQNRGLRQFFTACDRRFMELAKRVGDLGLPPARPFPMPRNGESRGSEARSGEVGCNGLTFFHTF